MNTESMVYRTVETEIIIIYTWKLAWLFFCWVWRGLVNLDRSWAWYGFHCCYSHLQHAPGFKFLDWKTTTVCASCEKWGAGGLFSLFLFALSFQPFLHSSSTEGSFSVFLTFPQQYKVFVCHLVVAYGWGGRISSCPGPASVLGRPCGSPSYGSSNLLCICIGFEWYFPIPPPVVKDLSLDTGVGFWGPRQFSVPLSEVKCLPFHLSPSSSGSWPVSWEPVGSSPQKQRRFLLISL